MRLTHLKLAGFKSFVDPTTLHLSGQRVAVVGPNGCGKSNVMEAIRWVLGESSARELRGDSMQDVIFNGSLNRKPVSRASVELFFDNSLGGVPGAWAQYAEIAVKRVLERDGTSSYIINNQHVRRRDITDLFLGTGVGSRAYAIIGQNTISRIVEAKPEELRMYLEEAAGVSRYKERRKETEARLRDTRENLLRVEDIRREINNQINTLQSQAEVARFYHTLKQQLETTQQLLWLLKKQQAGADWDKSRKRVEQALNDIEAEMAALRGHEKLIEQVRQQQIEAGQNVQQTQAAFYEASSHLSTTEQQLKHAEEGRLQSQKRREELAAQQTGIAAQVREKLADLGNQETLKLQAGQHHELMRAELESARAGLPQRENDLHQSQQALGNSQSALAKVEQAIQVAQTSLRHLKQQAEQLTTRRERQQEMLAGIALPDETRLIEAEQAKTKAEAQLAALQQAIAGLQEKESAQNATIQAQQESLSQLSRNLAAIESRLDTLRAINAETAGDGDMTAWLRQQGLDGQPRLWRYIKVNPAWEKALESVLGERLNALLVDALAMAGKVGSPPASQVFCSTQNAGIAAPQTPDSLLTQLEILESRMSGVLADWLHGVRTASGLNEALGKQGSLNPGEVLVCPDGTLVSPSSIKLYAGAAAWNGVLERQREILALEADMPGLHAQVKVQESALAASREQLQSLRSELSRLRQNQQAAAQQLQNISVETNRLQQARQHALDRQAQLQNEIADSQAQQQQWDQQLAQTGQELAAHENQLAAKRLERDEVRARLTQLDQVLAQAREALRKAERSAQESEYNERIINNKIIELTSSVKVLSETESALGAQLQRVEQASFEQDVQRLKTTLENALALRREKETLLAAARNTLAELDAKLLETDRLRMGCDQRLHPLRDKLEQARLAEQEARLFFDQCAQALAGVDEAGLLSRLEKSANISGMEKQARRLQEEIEALGAVNLAAIEQLATEQERASYLESQANDLNEAIATLEDAIQKIDRETRVRLQETFDVVNRHFADLFSTLFGGGIARLELLGDEILDTGVQVFAQPPGKRTSTIHLLSGGEKALVALALVFALFRLNPAPFCLMDEVDAPLDDSNTERFCHMVRKMSEHTQFVFITHNKIAMEMAQQLVGVTMQESGVSRVVEVDVEAAMRMAEALEAV
jgi:chromosome segregation protein